MTSLDMRRIQRAEHWREQRKRLMADGAPDAQVVPYLRAEAEALTEAVNAILARCRGEVGT